MRPLFIVDGEEKEIVLHLCPYAQVRMHGNGKRFSPEQIGRKCAETIQTNKGYTHYVILADLERREKKDNIQLADFEELIRNAIAERINNPDYMARVIVAGSNRMIENWLYAGVFGEDIDGQHGKNLLKIRLGSYKESKDGIGLFKSNRFDFTRALQSPSFKDFASQLPKGLCPKTDNALNP